MIDPGLLGLYQKAILDHGPASYDESIEAAQQTAREISE
jgi:hypothetical protein